MLKRRQFLLGSLITAGATGIALPAYSFQEADTLVIETVRIPMRDLERPLRVAQLTDIHWDSGHSIRWPLIEEAVERINRAEVDLVALTGDFVTEGPEPIHELAPLLGRLRARQGVYAVLGNHDHLYAHSQRTIEPALRRVGIEVLHNTWSRVGNLVLAGAGDYTSGNYEPERIFRTLGRRLPTLLLAHNPDGFWQLLDERIDLQLSGHTHGGQIRLPFVGPVLSLNRRLTGRIPKLARLTDKLPYSKVTHTNSWAGEYGEGNNRLYVSRGIGRFHRISIGCPPELTFFELLPG